MDVKERINELKEKLNEASIAYYVNDNPIMEDYEYDRLMDELIHFVNSVCSRLPYKNRNILM